MALITTAIDLEQAQRVKGIRLVTMQNGSWKMP